MTTTDRDVAEIAAGLTAHERLTMLGHLVELTPKESENLYDLNLKLPPRQITETITRTIYSVTPLGLAVRAHLASQERDKA